MFLLRYKRDGEPRLVVIANAYSVAHARLLAAGLEPGRFIDGQRVSPAAAARFPAWAVGKVLTFKQLAGLAKKKPPAPNLGRRGANAAG